jgi:gp16 family phage-associated protein
MLKPKTPEQVRAEFRAAGVSVAEWCRLHGFNRMTVVDLLRGTQQGLRGEAHRAAVALGMKVGHVIAAADFKPAAPRPDRRTSDQPDRRSATNRRAIAKPDRRARKAA